MTSTRLVLATTFAALAAGTPMVLHAQESLNTVKFGFVLYDTHAKTSGISGLGVPPGADAKVGNATAPLLTYERRFGPNYGLELAIGVPPRIKADGAGSVAFLGKDILSARNVAPTVLANYHFGASGDRWRPYAGVGINVTRFTGAKSSLAPKVELGDSVGLAVHAGVDYAFDKQWGAFASVSTLKVKSKLVATGATVLTSTIDFRPIVWAAGLSVRF